MEANEYIRLVDDVTGKIRVETGEKLVYPAPTERFLEAGKKRGVAVDPETAVLLRSRKTGDLRLHTQHGMYFPSTDDDIVKVQKLITLAEYQTMIIKDRFGQYHFVSGAIQAQPMSGQTNDEGKHDFDQHENVESKMTDNNDALDAKSCTSKMNDVVLGEAIGESPMFSQSKTPSLLQLNRSCNGQDGGVSFFLPPYCQIVELVWSSGVKRRNMGREKDDGV